MFLEEIFARMSGLFLAERARSLSFVLTWRFHVGRGEDGFDRFQTVIEDGCCVSGTEIGRAPQTTVTIAADDFFRVATGKAGVAALSMTGKVKVKGEYAPLVRLTTCFDIPKPAQNPRGLTDFR